MTAVPRSAFSPRTSPTRSRVPTSRPNCAKKPSACWAKADGSPREPNPEQEHVRVVVVARLVRTQPFVPILGFEPHLGGELIGEQRRSSIAIAGAGRTDIIVVGVRNPASGDEPPPERVIDLQRDLAREPVGDPDQGRFIDVGQGREPYGGQSTRKPCERTVDR